ncbi:MAG: SUMF1/EgtB/PvdO family nonheme iron enzyme [Xenococcus sp. (in: cyanobacteria)]
MEDQRKLKYIEETRDIFSKYQKFDRWAVIIGISQYKHKPWNLNYAHCDAQEFHQILLSDIGGSFKKENIRLLIDENATKSNIEDALLDFLQKPDKDDLVIMFFACHGAPDPNRPENVFLLPYDTNPAKIAATGIPMRVINDLFEYNTLLSKKVVILADTCHSGSIGGNIGKDIKIRGQDEEYVNELINKYLQGLAESKEGLALLTSSEAREVAREGEKWGGGHGVFTHYLLEGIKGAADEDKNGIVTVGELFEYVRENVKKATSNRQHPSIGTSPFDRKMPIGIKLDTVESILNPTPTPKPSLIQEIRTINDSNQNYYRQKIIVREVTLEMVKVPSGKFMMGATENEHYSAEKPRHQVEVKSFWIGKYPITQEQWQAVADMDKVFQNLDSNPSHFKGNKLLPVEKVSWYDALEFCARLSSHTGVAYRLLSETEWEYACRANTETAYFFSSNLSRRYARFSDPLGRTVPIGTYPPNDFGIHDMHGNIWEWCADPWHDDYNNAPNNSIVWDEKHQVSNYYLDIKNNISELINDDRWRVIRGGSWADTSNQCRSAFRYDQDPNAKGNTIGFRIAFSQDQHLIDL